MSARQWRAEAFPFKIDGVRALGCPWTLAVGLGALGVGALGAGGVKAQTDPNLFQFQRECAVYATKREELKAPNWTKLEKSGRPGMRIRGIESKASPGQILFSSPRFPGLILKAEKGCFDPTFAVEDDLESEFTRSEGPESVPDTSDQGEKASEPKVEESEKRASVDDPDAKRETFAVDRETTFWFGFGPAYWKEPFALTAGSVTEDLVVTNLGAFGVLTVDIPLGPTTLSFGLGGFGAYSMLQNQGAAESITYSAKSLEGGLYGEPAFFYSFVGSTGRQFDVGVSVPILGRFGLWPNTEGESAVTITPRFAILPVYALTLRYAGSGWTARPALTFGLTKKSGFLFSRFVIDFKL